MKKTVRKTAAKTVARKRSATVAKRPKMATVTKRQAKTTYNELKHGVEDAVKSVEKAAKDVVGKVKSAFSSGK